MWREEEDAKGSKPMKLASSASSFRSQAERRQSDALLTMYSLPIRDTE